MRIRNPAGALITFTFPEALLFANQNMVGKIFFFLFFYFIFHLFQSGSNTKMAVFTAIFYFLGHESKDVQGAALQALGFICIRHYDLMMQDSLKLK
jgi:hypothetical protein